MGLLSMPRGKMDVSGDRYALENGLNLVVALSAPTNLKMREQLGNARTVMCVETQKGAFI